MVDEENIPSFKHIAHDLNNIFTRILNSVELLKRKIKNYDASILLNSIESGTFLASEIIEESLSKSSAGSIPRRIKINPILQDIAYAFQSSLKGKIEFNLELESELELVIGRYSDFYRIFLNLISNSVEAIHEHGSIILKSTNSYLTANQILIEVTDTGRGIDEKLLPYIFEENVSTKSKETISGVGLAIVKNLVNKYNGSIEVSSQIGVGTSFKIIFPSLPKNETAEISKSILIAEDESRLQELLAELLQSYGYEITAASNGKEVIDFVSQNNFDLLIIDKKMPAVNGIECIERLRKSNCKIPIILASGSPLTDAENYSELAINKILNKPYNFDEMLSVIRELVS